MGVLDAASNSAVTSSDQLLDYDDSSLIKVRFLWTKRASLQYQSLSCNVAREVCSYYGSEFFLVPNIYKNVFTVLNVKTMRAKTASIAAVVTTGSVYCCLNIDLVICVGGHPAVRTAFSVSVPRSTVTPLPDMHTARAWPGIFATATSVYVFGGNMPSTRSCEKFSAQRWNSLPDMGSARYSFSPVLYAGELYLADAVQADRKVEAFSLFTETFRLVPFEMPKNAYGNSLAFACEDNLWLLAGDQYYVWSLSSMTMVTNERLEREKGRAYSRCPPLLFGGNAYFTKINDEDFACFHMEEVKLVKVKAVATV